MFRSPKRRQSGNLACEVQSKFRMGQELSGEEVQADRRQTRSRQKPGQVTVAGMRRGGQGQKAGQITGDQSRTEC